MAVLKNLHVNGNATITGNLNVEHDIVGATVTANDQIISNVPTGTSGIPTPPFKVLSTDYIENLNADMVDGLHHSDIVQTGNVDQIIEGSKTFNGTVNLNNNILQNPFLDNYSENIVTIPVSGSNCSIDCSAGNIFHIALSENCQVSFNNMPAAPAGKRVTLIFDNRGGYAVNWPATVLWQNGAIADLEEYSLIQFIIIDSGALIFAEDAKINYKTLSYDIEISSDRENIELRQLAIDHGWDGAANVQLNYIISEGVVVGSSDTSMPAITTGDLSDSQTVLINNGIIIGKGGNGGQGGSVSGNTVNDGQDGFDGGTALFVTSPLSVTNNGEIYGGGGGGGGGGSSWFTGVYSAPMGGGFPVNFAAGGGGGGAAQGFAASSGGGGGSANTSSGTENINSPGNSGGSSSVSAPGAGNSGGSATFESKTIVAGSGGSGGGTGENGGSGTAGNGSNNSASGNGGLAGYYVRGNSNVEWLNLGTVNGRVED